MVHSNCHTHTVFCDGKNTPEEMVQSAVDKGFSCLGFSFHSPMKDHAFWTIRPEKLPAYTGEIHRLQAAYADRIEILHGVELDSNYTLLDPAAFDYVIASVHQLTDGTRFCDVDDSAEKLLACCVNWFGGDWLALAAQYYETLSTFVTDVRPTVVGHYDLIEKFNENGVLFDSLDPRYLDIAKRHIDRILVHCPDVLFEVNTGAMYRCGKAQPYPAPPLLRYLCEKGAKVIVTSDSHNTASLDFAFDTALDCIRSAGFREVWELRRVDGKAVARATAV